MRLGFSLTLAVVAVLSWGGSFAISPYTAGRDPEIVRPIAAEFVRNATSIAAACFILSALILYWNPVYRRGWQAITFGCFLSFFLVTSIARLVWLEFIVLG